ncbi:DNA damage-responsive transcriptional repressor RPH1 [Malassezia restricta CBS 7877]|uniref:DNA damage-responsive transcriptional repressor RPH1 n=1 Tax=Malassezia restricta (strain ATCC 96810 / NBRC 103918 / CBS 7877) TaxID=425264 RepID=A0A3G2S0M4_MALR7|nr:DNA damage-responsive transcriptional repressor RPH1 [Malassezia restricta CBS 7877]
MACEAIQPSYFYATDSEAHISAGPDAKPSASLPGVPVFEPTMAQFADFYAFCQAIDAWGMQTGIVKIVPPREWVEALPSLRPDADPKHAHLGKVRIRHAITQHFLAAGPGRWKQTNVTRAKPYDAKQWSDLCMCQRGPAMSRIRRQVAANRAAEVAHQHSRSYTSSDAPPIDAPGKLTRSGGLSREASQRSVPKCKATTPQDWDTFDFEHSWLNEALTDAERDAGHHVSVRDWDVPSCRAIEAEYWRTLNLGMPPMYGADQQGTLFDDRTTQWNVGTLDSLLSRTLKCALPGVTTPYLYFGMWRASFAWHVEDMDLYSINYIHFGAPKQWYAIRQADRKRFESVMASTFPAEARKCAHFLRHKSFLVSPSVLASHGIQPLRLVQHAHEFVITYPYGYHSGYNLGFNCAESVNFALPTWIEIGRRADYCRCPLAQESVHFDVNAWWPTEQQSEPVALGHKCIFCPHDTSLDTLVPVPAEACAALERTNAKKSLSASASPYTAHRLCACFLPETWVDASSQVQGAATIERSRWTLKCQVCTDPADRLHGAKIQCTKGRCVHAVHVSCALNETSGWLLDICARETADQLEGVRSSLDAPEERAVVLCRAHNPHRRAIDMQRRHEAVRDKLRALAFPMPVRIKMQGAVWTVQLLGVDEAKHEVVVQESSTAAAKRVPWTCLVLDEKPSPDTHRESKKRRVHCARDVDIYEN